VIVTPTPFPDVSISARAEIALQTIENPEKIDKSRKLPGAIESTLTLFTLNTYDRLDCPIRVREVASSNLVAPSVVIGRLGLDPAYCRQLSICRICIDPAYKLLETPGRKNNS